MSIGPVHDILKDMCARVSREKMYILPIWGVSLIAELLFCFHSSRVQQFK